MTKLTVGFEKHVPSDDLYYLDWLDVHEEAHATVMTAAAKRFGAWQRKTERKCRYKEPIDCLAKGLDLKKTIQDSLSKAMMTIGGDDSALHSYMRWDPGRIFQFSIEDINTLTPKLVKEAEGMEFDSWECPK